MAHAGQPAAVPDPEPVRQDILRFETPFSRVLMVQQGQS